MGRAFLSTVVLMFLAAPLAAQCQQGDWACMVDQTETRLIAIPAIGIQNVDQKRYATGDVDQDGDVDLVAVYKQPSWSTGKRRNALFINESGSLTDRTLEYASASTVLLPGSVLSQALLDPTNDCDVVLADVTGDGWLDIVTATTLSGGANGSTGTKAISHPRVYVNRGLDATNTWQGFLFDDAQRVPTMPAEPRFLSVSAGDVDGDADTDLYFTDTHFGGNRPVDLNDRLWINAGNGYFTDETAIRMTAQMVESDLPWSSRILDVNGDGRLDIVKSEDGGAAVGVFISYNDASQQTHGVFDVFESLYSGAALSVNGADLNNDNLPDLFVTDKGPERLLLNIGNGADGLAMFAPPVELQSTDEDDEGKGDSTLADLDGDGWPDVIIASINPDFLSCADQAILYRHQANPPAVTFLDEGDAGIAAPHLQGVFDVAALDINGDDFVDLVLGSCTGTRVYMNQTAGVAFELIGFPGEVVEPGVEIHMQLQLTTTGVATGIVEGSVILHYSVDGGSKSVPLVSSAEGTYDVQLPPLQCPGRQSFYFSAQAEGSGLVFVDPPGAPANVHEVRAGALLSAVNEGFEGEVGLWTVVNDPSLTTGQWEAAVPTGTLVQGGPAAPFEDAEPAPAAMAFVTQNCLPFCGGAEFDVDGGPTDLLSPLVGIAGSDALVSYSVWLFVNNNHGKDALTIWVTDEGHVADPQWQLVETIVSDNTSPPAWQDRSFWVGDHVVPSAHVQVRFRVSDVLPNSVVEAGIDAFKVDRLVCLPCCEPCAGPADCADLDQDSLRDDGCTWWGCTDGACQGLPVQFADVGGPFGACVPDGATDSHDRFHVLNCFANTNTAGQPGYPCESAPPAAFNLDPGGSFGSCQPDGVCDGNDAFHAINTFSGQSACSCPGIGPAPNVPPAVVGRAFLVLEARSAQVITPGELMHIDVYLESASAAVRGYQLHLGVRGGQRGDVELVDVNIEPRPDRLFAESASWSAFNVETGQMLAGVEGNGVVAGKRRYLATFTFRAETNAAGDFAISLLADHTDPRQRTFIFTEEASGRVDVRSTSALVSVRHPRADRGRD